MNEVHHNGSASDNRKSVLNIEELYEKYGPMVFRRCKFLLGNEEKALDALQDVFVRLIERKEKISEVCCSFLYRIATTVCLNKIRSERLRSFSSIDDTVLDIAEYRSESHEDRTITALVLERLFVGMKENTRYMAVLHYVDGLTLEETARELHMSVSGVRKRLSVLRKKMKTEEEFK